MTVRSIDKKVFIISLLINNANRKKLLYSGVNELLYDKEFVGLVAREYVGQPVAFEAIHAIRSEDSLIKIDEITVTERIVYNFATVAELENVRFRVVLLGVQKKSFSRFLFNPLDNTILEPGDVLLVVGNYMFIREFTKFISKKKV